MKSPETVVHGTSSEKDAEKIQEEGFKAQEGRATVSGDLIYAFEWAKNQERRKGSKSETEIADEEEGRLVIMGVPEGMSVDYATNTGVEVDDSSKEISGYSSKYESGRRQLAIYGDKDVKEKREDIEKAKQELKELRDDFFAYLRENNLEPESIRSKEDLIEAIKPLELKKKVEVLQKAEEYEKQSGEKRKEAEMETTISQENVLMSIKPTQELGEKLDELSQQIRNLEKVDLLKFTEDISDIIESNEENFVASGLDVREVVQNLVTTTMETEIVNMVRSLSLDVKRAQGYEVFNRGHDEKKEKEKEVDKTELKAKLETILSIADKEDFDTGMPSLNRYVRMNVKKLLAELENN